MKFTKEQLIERCRGEIELAQITLRNGTSDTPHAVEERMQIMEITLAVLTGKPFMHGIADPDGMAHFDEHCVAETPVTLTDEVAFLNEGCESPGEEYAIVPLYRMQMLEGLK
ncbi:hypothetical protein [Huaxiibacter chinensis]|uniref:hypothetical protein n=1 Tax=Huaxiibacter chinensis TaxID=2899785 RepID=UPI003F95C1F2